MTAHPSMWQLCSNPQPTHSQYLGAKGRGNAAIFFSCSISSGDAFSYGLLEQAAASNFRCWGIGIRLPFFVYRQVWVYYNLTAAHRTAKGIMQAVNNGGVADYGSVIVVMESAIVVFSNYSVAIVVVRDEFIAAYLTLYIMWQIVIFRFLWRQGCAVWFCIERFFQLFARKKLLANEIFVTFKASKAKKDSTDNQSENENC